MKQESNLPELIYRDIVTNIYIGKLNYGDRLPTLVQICEKYGIGRNTARSVLQLLIENGYVSQVTRKQMCVCFNFDNQAVRQRYLADMAQRRDTIQDIFSVLALIFPDIAIFSIRSGGEKERKQLANICAVAVHLGIRSPKELFLALYDVYRFALSLSKNKLLISLFDALFQSIMLPLSTADQRNDRFRLVLPLIRLLLKGFTRHIIGGNYDTLKGKIKTFCISSSKRSDRYLARICAGYPRQPGSPFVWITDRCREYRYVTIIADILQNILSGAYRPGALLPSYAELAEQYGVSEKTSRKAIEVLNQLQVVQIANGKRTRVAQLPAENLDKLFAEPIIQGGLLDCLEAMQLLAIISNAVAAQALPLLDSSQMETFAQSHRGAGNEAIQPICQLFFKAIPSPCLHTILDRLMQAVGWGRLLEYLHPDIQLRLSVLVEELITLLEAGDPEPIIRSYQALCQGLFLSAKCVAHQYGVSCELIGLEDWNVEKWRL